MSPPPGAKYLLREFDDVAREFYRRLSDDRQLATTRCAACDTTSFPPLERCPRCGGPSEWVTLPRRGRLYAFTSQETAVRFAAPAVLALVDLGEVVVPAVARAPYPELAIGRQVSVELLDEPETGLTVLELVSGRSASQR